jgi:hypothetical protein
MATEKSSVSYGIEVLLEVIRVGLLFLWEVLLFLSDCLFFWIV